MSAQTAPTQAKYVRPGTRGQDTQIIPFEADDGVPLTMLHVTRQGSPPTPRGPVMLVHGAGVRAEIFRPPLEHTLVDALLDDGFDVWMLNWRASIDLRPVAWTLDDAAEYDYPAAVRLILGRTGMRSLKAFVHCQGSTSFMISAIAGLVPEVTTIVTNAVSLHTLLPAWSGLKIRALTPLVRRHSPTLSPKWGYRTEGRFSRALRTAVVASHPECASPVCAMVSFTYGAGHPALWAHRNIDQATHEWITGEFAGAPMTFFAQMRDSVRAGHLVPTGENPNLPTDYLAAPQTDARLVFLAGGDNRCFLPESQRRSFAHFDAISPGRHSHHEFPGYGHLDVIFGADAWRDTYPVILDELRR